MVVTWDGAGNVVPFQALVQALAGRGHAVTVLSHAASRPSFEAHDCRFEPYPSATTYDAAERRERPERANAAWAFENIWCSEGIGRDTIDVIGVTKPDVAVVDSTLFFAQAAVEAAAVPAAVLFHAPMASERARSGHARMFEPVLAPLNEFRASLGLPNATSIAAAVDAAGVAIAATAPTFDPPAPESRAIQVGPIRPTTDGNGLSFPEAAKGAAPLVVVGLSTGWMHQLELLQRVLDAIRPLPVRVLMTLGRAADPADLDVPPNATLAAYVPHELVLPHASLLITHAGHGTVNVGLCFGVPMLCMPMGRDQPFNAARAAELGAAGVLDPSASVDEVRNAIEHILADEQMTSTCRELARRMAVETRLDLAVSTLEGLVKR